MDEAKQKLEFSLREYARIWQDAGVESVASWIPALAETLARAERPSLVAVPPPPLSLDELRRGLAARCPGCASGRPVFGAGDPSSPLMFVGERPSEEEQKSEVPFLGPEGLLLGKIIEAMGSRREKVYLTTLYKCRPNAGEPAPCSACLEEQISVIRPKVVVALGEEAAQALIGTDASLAQLRGKLHPHSRIAGVQVMATFSPQRLLEEPATKRLVWDDMKIVMNRLQSPGREETTT